MDQSFKRVAPLELSDEDRVWLNSSPGGLEWPNCAVPGENTVVGTLRPPPGHNSWLEYAVMRLETRELHRMSLFDESIWGHEVPRKAFLDAAQQELRALRTLAGSAVTKMVSMMSEQEFSNLLDNLFQIALEDGDLGYRYWHNVIDELKDMRKALSAR